MNEGTLSVRRPDARDGWFKLHSSLGLLTISPSPRNRLLKIHLALCSFLLAAAAPAQTTWIVDANQGPGTDFTDIQPAVDAAAAGDIISIRAGSYSEFSVSKALVIQGVAGVVVDRVGFATSALTVSGIGVGETLSIHRIAIDPPLSLVPAVQISGNSGRVLLQRVDVRDLPVNISQSEAWLTDSQLNRVSPFTRSDGRHHRHSTPRLPV